MSRQMFRRRQSPRALVRAEKQWKTVLQFLNAASWDRRFRIRSSRRDLCAMTPAGTFRT